MTYGYLDEGLLPVTVTASSIEISFPLGAKANWLVCEKICVPEEGSLRLDIPGGGMTPSPEASLFANADRRIPQPSPFVAMLAPDGSLFVESNGTSVKSVADGLIASEIKRGDEQVGPFKMDLIGERDPEAIIVDCGPPSENPTFVRCDRPANLRGI